MLGRTHLLMGIFLGLLFWFLPLSLTNKIIVLALCIFGSLFPDIDTPNSILGRKVKLLGWLFSHRGFFHGFFALALFTVLIVLFTNLLYGLSFAAGFISHLLMDSLSKEGIFLLGKRFKGWLKVGGLIEKSLQLFLLVCIFFIFIYFL